MRKGADLREEVAPSHPNHPRIKMTPGPWPGEDDSSQLPNPAAPLDDEQMARHLASRYSATQLSQLFHRVGVIGSVHTSDDRASTLTSPTYVSSGISEEPASMFDSGASIKSFSNSASTFTLAPSTAPARQSTCSLTQAQTEHAHTQPAARSSQGDSPSALVSPASTRSTDSVDPSTSSPPKQKSSFMCSLCKEVDIVKTCTRKNDLKRHIEDFHYTDAQWICRYRGCRLVFDWQTAYKAHLKAEHGGSRMSPEEARVSLCPQVVFACGFENCLHVCEARDDTEAPHVFKDYVAHVMKHFDDGAQSGEWTYSRRMKNLLSQGQVHHAWVSCGLDAVSRSRLQWDPQTSSVLRKRLECRHIRDPVLLVKIAVSMGSDVGPPPECRPDFVTPLRDSCTESMPGHKTLKRSLQQDPAEQFNFRMPPGSNPALAQYFNAHRRIHVPRQPVVGRRHTHSSRQLMPVSAPKSSSTINGLGHYSLLNNRINNGHYDPGISDAIVPPMYSHSPQSFGMAGGLMHQQPQEFMGGDGVHSLRSASPEGGISMTDATGHSPIISMSYGGMVHPSRTADMSSSHGMEQNNQIYQDEPRHDGAVLNGDYLEGNL